MIRKTITLFLISFIFGLGVLAQNCNNYFLTQQNTELKFTFRAFMEKPADASFSWDLGDGTTTSGVEISHSYGAAGTYQVCLYSEVLDSLGNMCYDTTCEDVVAGNPPGCVALFYTRNSPIYPLNWTFTDFSSGTPTSWEWDFGDGNTSNSQSLVHTYAMAGTYTVCLTIYDANNNCEDTYCEEITVLPEPVECESDFTYETDDDQTFDFEGFMDDPQQTDVEYAWDFGDGNTGTGQFITYTYAPVQPTYYNVCLTTTFNAPGGEPCVHQTCYPVLVGTTINCQALFTQAFGALPLSIDFTDISIGEPSLWEWDFGDSTYSSEQHPTHVYNREGIYNVCLTITNESNGCTSTLCNDVNVNNVPPPINCINTIQTTPGSDIYTFSFHGEAFSNGNNVSSTSTFHWNFGGGNTAQGQDSEFTFSAPGDYAVTLATVSILNGTDTCTAYSLDSIHIMSESLCVGGFVYLADQIPADIGEVQLVIHDAASNTILSVLNTSINTDGSYLFEGVSENEDVDLYIQANLSPQSINFGHYAPSYHTEAIHWDDAQLGIYEECPPATSQNILMHAYTSVVAGNGNISGVIYNGNTREVMADVEVLLFNEGMEVLGYNYTNDEGMFEFASIAYGTYYIYPERVGIETDGFMITISEETPSQELGIVIVDGAAELSLEEYSLISILEEIYPNPANTNINVSLSAEKDANLELTVFNQLGQQMFSQRQRIQRGANTVELNIASLPESVYYLRMQAGNGKPVMRSFVKFK